MSFNKPVFLSLASRTSLRSAIKAAATVSTQSKLAEKCSHSVLELYPQFHELEFTAQGRQAISKTLHALGIKSTHRILTNAFCCCAVEQSLRSTGADVVFIDIGANLELSLKDVKQYVKTHKIDVIFLQALFGYAQEVESIIQFCKQQDIVCIVDLAQSFGAHYKGTLVGQDADALIFSFGRDKVLESYQGGAYTLNIRHSWKAQPTAVRQASLVERFYPLSMVLVRTLYPIGLGKAFHALSKKLLPIKNPMVSAQQATISNVTLALVNDELKKSKEHQEHTRRIALVYHQFLKNWSPISEEQIRGGVCLRYPVLVPDVVFITQNLEKKGVFISDRWYRAVIDCGSCHYDSQLADEQDSFPNSLLFSNQLLNLPTHKNISSKRAVEIASYVRSLVKAKSELTYTTCESAEQWKSILDNYPQSNFLQSWNWGEFQKSLGRDVERFLFFNNGAVCGAAQVCLEVAKRGSFVVCAGGPITDWTEIEQTQFAIATITNWAKYKQARFVRIRPQEIERVGSQAVAELLFSNKSPMHVTADLTLQLDLTHTDEDLLMQMRKNTRSAIRKAEKVGITTKISTELSDIQAFYDVQLEVAQRQNFVPFSYEFLRKQFEAFAVDNEVALIHGYKDDVLLASAFILFSQKEAVYHYGVSTSENRSLPGAYAVQWRAIKEARNRGCVRYNFWGIAPKDADNHRFSGVSLFKRGFGGREVAYVPAHDVIISPWYWLTWTLESIRRKKRHLE